MFPPHVPKSQLDSNGMGQAKRGARLSSGNYSIIKVGATGSFWGRAGRAPAMETQNSVCGMEVGRRKHPTGEKGRLGTGTRLASAENEHTRIGAWTSTTASRTCQKMPTCRAARRPSRKTHGLSRGHERTSSSPTARKNSAFP